MNTLLLYARYLIFSVITCCSVALFAYPSSGSEAPKFTKTDINSIPQSISENEGKVIVLEWTNPECSYVRKHYLGSKNIPNMQAEFTKNPNVVWFLICSQGPGQEGHKTPEEWKEILHRWDAKPSAMLIDDSGSIARMYGVTKTPEFVIIGPDGTIAYRGAIDTIPSTDPEDVVNPINRQLVREAIDNLLKGKYIYTSETIPYGCPIKTK